MDLQYIKDKLSLLPMQPGCYLMTHGVDGIHIYTMNKPEIAKEILKRTEYIRDEFFKD